MLLLHWQWLELPLYVCLYVCMHVCMYVCMYVCMAAKVIYQLPILSILSYLRTDSVDPYNREFVLNFQDDFFRITGDSQSKYTPRPLATLWFNSTLYNLTCHSYNIFQFSLSSHSPTCGWRHKRYRFVTCITWHLKGTNNNQCIDYYIKDLSSNALVGIESRHSLLLGPSVIRWDLNMNSG